MGFLKPSKPNTAALEAQRAAEEKRRQEAEAKLESQKRAYAYGGRRSLIKTSEQGVPAKLGQTSAG